MERVEAANSQITKSGDWVIAIQTKLAQERSSINHCVFRVPKNLREMEPKAYIPQIVSIGPYHRGKKRHKEMEIHKWRLLQRRLRRTETNLEPCLDAMLELVEKTRRCYGKPIKGMKSPEFVEMMLLDACFILELLTVKCKGLSDCDYSEVDPIFTSRGVLPCIQRDLLMIENQLPLFVLDRLFALTSKPDEPDSVSQLALRFFDSFIHGRGNQHHEVSNTRKPESLHLLHVVHQSLLPSSRKSTMYENQHHQRKMHCVTKLRDSGVKFKKKDSDKFMDIEHQLHHQLKMHCVTKLRDSGVKFKKKDSEVFMDIEFKKGVLYIPPLRIYDSTKSLFLNLMAFEQYYPHCSNHVTSYTSFMDGLINCPQDVGYLRYKGIIDHGLGSEEEVASLFNNLCREIAFDIDDCYLSGVSTDVNRYFDRKWHTWRASLKHDYFSNPWAIVSLLAAILLIGLTLAQTFYTVFAYYIPSS